MHYKIFCIKLLCTDIIKCDIILPKSENVKHLYGQTHIERDKWLFETNGLGIGKYKVSFFNILLYETNL